MSVEGSEITEAIMANEGDHTADEPEESIPVMSTIDINEMQPNVDKVVHVTKIYIPPDQPNPAAEVTTTTDAAASETVNSVEPPHVVVQSGGMPLAGSVVTVPAENGEIVPIQLQPTYPAAHPLPDVTVDVDHAEKVGEIVPITIQPAYPLAHNASDNVSTDNVVIPAYPAAHLPVPSPVLEESCPTVRIEPDLVRFGTVMTAGLASISEVHSSFAEPLYPAAHPLPIVTAAIIDDDGMNEIPLSPVVEPGARSQISDEHTTANGTTDNVQVTIEQRNASRRRGIVLTVVLLVLLVSSFAVWSVYKFILKNSPA